MKFEIEKTEIKETELEIQTAIIKKIRAINDNEYKITGCQKYYYNLVMGCQMNAHDSEKLSGMLTEMGYIETLEEHKADFVIYNTCCVRENAEEKVYGKLGWLKTYKENNPNLIIAVCGCMMQQDSVIQKIKKSYRHVDIVFGTFNIYKLPQLIETRLETGKTVFDIWQEQKEIVEDLPSIREHSFKASVNIMYGCNNFCTYCIVPYVRGRERSRTPEDILKEIKSLVFSGVKEVMLLGQNVNSYGKNLDNPISFAQLLISINEIEGLERISFMTSHPKDLSDELIFAMKKCNNVMNFLHIPFQSGSSNILAKMNRHYTKEKYLELINKIKRELPGISISTDIIVGFPGETEEDFLDTLQVVDEVRFSNVYTFVYSKRQGTPAAEMENNISEEIIKNRFERLLNRVKAIMYEINSAQVETIQDVLVEDISKNNNNVLTGRTKNNTLIHFEGNNELIGKIIKIKVTDNKTFYLFGERL